MSIATRKVEIIVDIETLRQTLYGSSISGKIYWRFDDFFFPEQHWHDFVTPLLNWWSTSIIEILFGSCEKATLLYMDGPQQMIIKADDAYTLTFECYDRYDSNIQKDPEYVFTVDQRTLLRRMILTMTRVIECIYRKNFSLDDSLKSELEHIKENAMKLKGILKAMGVIAEEI